MPYEDNVNIVYTGDASDLDAASKEASQSFLSFQELIVTGIKGIYHESQKAAEAFKALGDAIAAPLNKIAKTSGVISGIIGGSMAFAAESAQEYYAQTRIMQQTVEHANHALEEEAKILESVGKSSESLKKGIVDVSSVMNSAEEASRRLGVSQKAIMSGFSNLAGVLPNTNNEWYKFAKISAFAAQHHPQYGDMATQMQNLSAAIATGNTRMLRHIAGNINLQEVYKNYAKQINKSRNELTQMEKATATFLYLQKQIGDVDEDVIRGMNVQADVANTLKRIWLSLGRIVFPIWQGIKKAIVTVLDPIARGLERAAKRFEEFRNSNEGTISGLSKILRPIGILIGFLGKLIAKLIELGVYIATLPIGILTGLFVSFGAAANIAALAVGGFFAVIAFGIKIGGLIKMGEAIGGIITKFNELKKVAGAQEAIKGLGGIIKEAFMPKHSFEGFKAIQEGARGFAGAKNVQQEMGLGKFVKGAIAGTEELGGVQRAVRGVGAVFKGFLNIPISSLKKFNELLGVLRTNLGTIRGLGKVFTPLINGVEWITTAGVTLTEKLSYLVGRITGITPPATKATSSLTKMGGASTTAGKGLAQTTGWIGRIAQTAPRAASAIAFLGKWLGRLGTALGIAQIVGGLVAIGRAARVMILEYQYQDKVQQQLAQHTKDSMGGAIKTLTMNMEEYKQASMDAFKTRGVEGLQAQRDKHREQLRGLIEGGADLGSKEVKNMVKVIQNDTALIKGAQQSVTKNRYATNDLLKKDVELQRRAAQEQKRIEALQTEAAAIGGKDPAKAQELVRQIQEIGAQYGLTMEQITGDVEKVNENLMKGMIRVEAPKWLEDMGQQFEQLTDKVNGLKERIMNMTFEAERFVQSFKLGGTALSGADKAAASIELLVNQLQRAKESGAKPEQLKQMTEGILNQIPQLAEERMREFELTPGGRAMQLRIDAMPEGSIKQQALRNLRAKFEQEVRTEFGAEGLLQDYELFNQQAIQEQENELEKAKKLLEDVKNSAVAMSYIFEKAGGDVEKMNEALKNTQGLLEVISGAMGGLTDEQKEQLDVLNRQLTTQEAATKQFTSEKKIQETLGGLQEVTQFTPEQLQQGFQKFGAVANEHIEEVRENTIEMLGKMKEGVKEVNEESDKSLGRARIFWDTFWNFGLGKTGEELRKREKELGSQFASLEVNAPGHAAGGKINGPGGIDKVNARLTRDEVVIRTGVSRPWMEELLEFNRTGDPSVFFRGRGYRRGGRVGGRIGYQTGGVVTENSIERLLSANYDVLNTMSSKLDVLPDISEAISQMISRLDAMAKGLTVNVQIPDTKVSFDPLRVMIGVDDVGRLATKDDLRDLQPRLRSEGFGNV